MMAGGMVFAMVAIHQRVPSGVSQHRQKVRTLRGEDYVLASPGRHRNVADARERS